MNNITRNQVLVKTLGYLERGFSVIPVGQDKKPLIEWKKYQTQFATEDEVRQWFSNAPGLNIGIVTGEISGITVVDIEKGGNCIGLPPTVTTKTGGGGYHMYYKYKSGIGNKVRMRELTDIRSDGGYVVAPPSLHTSGERYEWVVSPDDADFAELPDDFIKEDEVRDKVDNWDVFLHKNNPEGVRNNKSVRVAGKILKEMSQTLWELSGWPSFKEWNNKRNKPPLPEKELRATWEWTMKQEATKRKDNVNQNQADKIAKIVLDDSNIYLFRDDHYDAYAQINVDDHKEVWNCNSSFFRRWIVKQSYEKLKKIPSSDGVNMALTAIKGKACFNDNFFSLSNRIAQLGDDIYYDLTNKEWSAIKINRDGWEIIRNPPILFKRYTHQQPQTDPVKDGDIEKFLDFVNISNEEHQRLLLIYLVSCFIPDFPHPCLVLYGEQGAAKSMLSKLLRKLIDPSLLDVLSFPRYGELIQNLSHNYFAFFDNISKLEDYTSDALCRAITGEGFSKRELYTNDDDIIYVFQRCIGLNGINLSAQKADLLDRSILFYLERISNDKRRTEKEIYKEFNEVKPKILGGILNTLVKAIKIRETLKMPSNLPRMADFTVWGCAIAEALGYGQDSFLEAYYKNINKQNEELIEDCVVASTLQEFMSDQEQWSGTATELLNELEETAELMKIKIEKDKAWPKAANTLSRKINVIKTNLKLVGITINKVNREFVITHKDAQNTSNTVISSEDTMVSIENGDDTTDNIDDTLDKPVDIQF